MFELWKMKNHVNMYVRLIVDNPEEARKNCQIYIQDADLLTQTIEYYIDSTSNEFNMWCKSYIVVWMAEETNLFLKLKRKILIGIVYYYLNKLSKEMEILAILQKNMKFVNTRLNQFYNFTVYTKRI